ncbi:MAG: hypothetical protein ABR950_05520 [Candidatus Dormibacteria bacterium]|jgi:hypothetical protein
MIDDVERLDAALNRQRIGASVDDLPSSLRGLVQLAAEIGDAYRVGSLSPADRERIYAESLLQLEAALRAHRHLWQRLDGRGVAVIGGAAAVTAVAAAIGVRVIVGHRGHRLHPAAI